MDRQVDNLEPEQFKCEQSPDMDVTFQQNNNNHDCSQDTGDEVLLYVDEPSSINDRSCTGYQLQQKSRHTDSTDHYQQMASPALLGHGFQKRLGQVGFQTKKQDGLRHKISAADLSCSSHGDSKDFLVNGLPSHCNSIAAPVSSEKAIPLDLSVITDNTILSKKTSRVAVDGVVSKQQFSIDNQHQIGSNRQKQTDSSANGAQIGSSKFQHPGTVKKRAFNNITYSLEHNQSKLTNHSMRMMQTFDEGLENIDNDESENQNHNSSQHLSVGLARNSTVQYCSQNHKKVSEKGDLSKKNKDAKSSPSKKNCEKENDVGYHSRSIQHPENSIATFNSINSDNQDKVLSLSPSKFERFIELNNSCLKNPFVTRKPKNLDNQHFQITEDADFDMNSKRDRKHFTKSAIYSERAAQVTDRSKRLVTFGQESSQGTPLLSSSRQLTKRDVYQPTASNSFDINRINVVGQTLQPNNNKQFQDQQIKLQKQIENNGIDAEKMQKQNDNQVSSPDNIVKWLMRKTNEAKARNKEQYCLHLAQKIAESNIHLVDAFQDQQDQANNKQHPVNMFDERFTPKKEIESTDKGLFDNKLNIITEESQTNQCDEQSQSFPEVFESKGETLADPQEFQNSGLPNQIPRVQSQLSSDTENKSLTFTELEMQVQAIQDKEDLAEQKLNQLIVPKVPTAIDQNSQSSLNTEGIFMAYKNMLYTSNNNQGVNVRNLETIQSFDSRELLRDSLDGASPGQKPYELMDNPYNINQQFIKDQFQQQVLKNYCSDVFGTKRITNPLALANLMSIGAPNSSVQNSNVKSTNQFLVSQNTSSKLSQSNTKQNVIASETVNSCHVHEENFYIKEIDKLRTELKDLNQEETQLLQVSLKNQEPKGSLQYQKVSDDQQANVHESEIVLDDPQKDGQNESNLDQQGVENPAPDSVNRSGVILEVGEGLFKNKTEYKAINKSMDEFKSSDDIISIQSEPPPVVHTKQSSPMDNQIEQSNQPELPEDNFENQVLSGSIPNQIFEKQNPKEIESQVYDTLIHRIQKIHNSQISPNSPPCKQIQDQKPVGLNLANLMNPIQITDNERSQNISTQNSEVQALNVEESQTEPRSDQQVFLCGHDHQNDFLGQKLTGDFKISAIPIGQEQQLLNVQNQVSEPICPKDIQFMQLQIVQQVELDSPNSYVLKPIQIQMAQIYSKSKSQVLRNQNSLSPSKRRTSQKSQKSQESPQTKIQPKKLNSMLNSEKKSSQKKKSQKIRVNEQSIFKQAETLALKEPDSSVSNPISELASGCFKKQRRSRKSRSGSTGTTKLNQFIKKCKVSAGADDRGRVTQQNSQYLVDKVKQQNLQFINQRLGFAKEQEEISELQQQLNVSQKVQLHPDIKSPSSHNMFDQRFENTDKQCQSSQLSSINKQQSHQQQPEEKTLQSQASFFAALAGRKSQLQPYANSMSLNESPSNNVVKQDLLMNPKIIDSRNVVNSTKLQPNNSNNCLQGKQQNILSETNPVTGLINKNQNEQLSHKSSHSSLFNSQMLKQQKEPVDDDYKIATVNGTTVQAGFMGDISTRNIVNIQSKNDKTEIQLLDPLSDSFDDQVEPKQDALTTVFNSVSQHPRQEMMIQDTFLDDLEEKRLPLSMEPTPQTTDRKAVIQMAEKLLLSGAIQSTDTGKEKNRAASKVAQSTKNLRLMMDKVGGGNLVKSNQYCIGKSDRSSLLNSDYSLPLGNRMSIQVIKSGNFKNSQPQIKINNFIEATGKSHKIQQEHFPSSKTTARLVHNYNNQHQRSQYCEELNISSTCRNNFSSSQKRRHQFSSSKNESQLVSKPLPLRQSVQGSQNKQMHKYNKSHTPICQNRQSQQNLKPFINYQKAAGIEKSNSKSQLSKERRFKNKQAHNLKVITDVNHMQTNIQTIKKKIIDKYSCSSNFNASPPKNNQVKEPGIARPQTDMSTKSGKPTGKQEYCFNFAQKSFDDRSSSKNLAQNDLQYGEINQNTHSNFDRLTCGSTEIGMSKIKNNHKNELKINYFVKPQDLRSKSNSNIGCGLNQIKQPQQSIYLPETNNNHNSHHSISVNVKAETPDFDKKQDSLMIGDANSNYQATAGLNSTQKVPQVSSRFSHVQKHQAAHSYFEKSSTSSATHHLGARNRVNKRVNAFTNNFNGPFIRKYAVKQNMMTSSQVGKVSPQNMPSSTSGPPTAFSQKNSVVVMSSTNAKSPFKPQIKQQNLSNSISYQNSPKKSHSTCAGATRNSKQLSKQQLRQKQLDSDRQVEQLFQQELEAQGLSQSFVVITNQHLNKQVSNQGSIGTPIHQSIDLNPSLSRNEQTPSGNQCVVPPLNLIACQQNLPQKRHNYLQTGQVTPDGHCHGGAKGQAQAYKLGNPNNKFNKIRRSQMMRKQQKQLGLAAESQLQFEPKQSSPGKSASRQLQHGKQPLDTSFNVQPHLRAMHRLSLGNTTSESGGIGTQQVTGSTSSIVSGIIIRQPSAHNFQPGYK